MQQYTLNTQGQPLCIYGNLAHPQCVQLHCPFQKAVLKHPHRDFNKSISKVRVSVEWMSGDIVNWFAFLDLKKPLKFDSVQLGKCVLHVHYWPMQELAGMEITHQLFLTWKLLISNIICII